MSVFPISGAQPSLAQAKTDCCIVGAGPAGATLALLLARQGVRVTLLEAHRHFERDFRGNTLNPATLELLQTLGLLERLLKLPHSRIERFTLQTAVEHVVFADFSRLRTPFPFMLMLPQARYLELIIAAAQRYPHFQLLLGARVERLIEERGSILGVSYQGSDGPGEIRARLTIGADGRFSRLRRLAGLASDAGASPMDVLWFRLPRWPDDPDEAGALFRFGPGSLLVLMDDQEDWQLGYIIAKGSYQQVRAAGLETLRQTVAALAPELADRVGQLQDWQQITLLSVASDCLCCWHRPGLLLLGDAAHVMSPVGGVGINLSIQDAVVAANLLAAPLREGRLERRHLAAVQRRRIWPTRIVQAYTALIQSWVVAAALRSREPFQLPRAALVLLRLPLLGRLPGRLIAFGAWRVRLKQPAPALLDTPEQQQLAAKPWAKAGQQTIAAALRRLAHPLVKHKKH